MKYSTPPPWWATTGAAMTRQNISVFAIRRMAAILLITCN
jgi:hypothetical protein